MLHHFASLNFNVPEFLIILVVVAVLAFELAMLVSAFRNRAISDTARLLWVLGMLFIHPIVAVAYFLTDYRKAR